MADGKNPTAVRIGQRIKQARKMAGFDSAAQLLPQIPNWGPSRLGNYEAGISIPSPDDIQLIAQVTNTSPCWIMFGLGPIRATGRDVQAIRHQNLVFIVDQCHNQRGKITQLLKTIGISRKKLEEHLNNPFLNLSDRLARKCEKFSQKPNGWLDEQHVESDPVCATFPDEMRQIMEIYSNLNTSGRTMLLRMAKLLMQYM